MQRPCQEWQPFQQFKTYFTKLYQCRLRIWNHHLTASCIFKTPFTSSLTCMHAASKTRRTYFSGFKQHQSGTPARFSTLLRCTKVVTEQLGESQPVTASPEASHLGIQILQTSTGHRIRSLLTFHHWLIIDFHMDSKCNAQSSRIRLDSNESLGTQTWFPYSLFDTYILIHASLQAQYQDIIPDHVPKLEVVETLKYHD